MLLQKNQRGFGIIELLLVLAAFLLAGFLLWYLWNTSNKTQQSSSDSKTQPSQQDSKPNQNPNLVTIMLISKTSGNPITRTKVTIYSDNGIRCIQAPCPTNGKSWQGSTNEKGILLIPKENIQQSTDISTEGYGSMNLKYVEDKQAYTIEL